MERTLAELIEACGEDFEGLNCNTNKQSVGNGDHWPEKWHACGGDTREDKNHVYAATAEEAVEGLLLVLKKDATNSKQEIRDSL